MNEQVEVEVQKERGFSPCALVSAISEDLCCMDMKQFRFLIVNAYRARKGGSLYDSPPCIRYQTSKPNFQPDRYRRETILIKIEM